MIVVNEWCESGMGVYGDVEMSVHSMGGWGKTSIHTFSNILLKTLTEGAVTTEALSTLTKNASSPHIGIPCRGALLGRFKREGEKTSSDQYPNGS